MNILLTLIGGIGLQMMLVGLTFYPSKKSVQLGYGGGVVMLLAILIGLREIFFV